MSVFDAALAVLVADVNLGVDAAFTAGAASFTIRALPYRGDERVGDGGGFGSLVTETVSVDVRVADYAAGAGRDPVRGDTLAWGGETFVITAARRADGLSSVWRIALRPA